MDAKRENTVFLYIAGHLDFFNHIEKYFAMHTNKFECKLIDDGFLFTYVFDNTPVSLKIQFVNNFAQINENPNQVIIFLASTDTRVINDSINSQKNIPIILTDPVDSSLKPNPNSSYVDNDRNKCFDFILNKVNKMIFEFPVQRLNVGAMNDQMISNAILKAAQTRSKNQGFFKDSIPELQQRFDKFNKSALNNLLYFLKDSTYGSGENSFKFQVVAELTGCKAKSNAEAHQYIQLLTNKIDIFLLDNEESDFGFEMLAPPSSTK